MKVQVLVALLFGVCCSWVTANEIAFGSPVSARDFPTDRDCKGFFGRRCFNCTHLQFCAGQVEVAMQECLSVNPNTPYCSNLGCSAVGEPKCNPPFICTGGGLFPDLTDCSRYYLCDKAGDPAELFECPPQFVYDSRMENCKRRRTAADCQTIVKTDKSILAFCPAGSRTPVLYRCADYVYGEFDAKTLQCTFKCPGEGRFPDRLDCHKFYECYRSGNTFGLMHQDCGAKFMYDRKTTTCKPNNSCVSDVAEPTPAPASTVSKKEDKPQKDKKDFPKVP